MRRFDKKQNIQKANLIAEQRYLESKGLIKEDSQMGLPIQKEQEIDEVGPETAARAISDKASMDDDPRTKRILQDAVSSMFKKYYRNNDAKFAFQTKGTGQSPANFVLWSVNFHKDKGIVEFGFMTKEQERSESVSLFVTYDLFDDVYNGADNSMMNQFSARFFVVAANALRKMWYTRFPDEKAGENFDFNTRVKKQDFRFF